MSKQQCCTCGKTRTECADLGLTFWSEPSQKRHICDNCREVEIELQIQEFQASDPDTQGTDLITCPHCGYEDIDSWEHDEGSDSLSCGNCSMEFAMERNIEITYSTKKA